VIDRRVGRELLPPGSSGARLTLAPDHPVEFDAWDLEQWTASLAVPLGPAHAVEVVEAGPLLGAVRVHHRFGASTVTQDLVLRAGRARLDVELDIDWQEDEKLLAIEFPLDVRADTATCEIQFGHEHRPTHANTTWDDAKFEVCAHRWVDLSEPGFGVAVLNDGRHGHAVQGFPDGPGIRVSLLRSPRYPDPGADRGRHRTTVALLPHGPGLTEVLAEAEALNLGLRVVPGGANAALPPPVLEVGDPRVLVSAVKDADDGSGDLVVRLWEATGDRVRTTLRTGAGVAAAVACNLLEEPLGGSGPPLAVEAGAAVVELRPFQLATLRLTRSS
jgi:alpha-mannosidase